MDELPWITIFWSRVRLFAKDFTSDEVTSENLWQNASRYTEVKEYIKHIVSNILCSGYSSIKVG